MKRIESRVIVPLVTPYLEKGTIDEQSLRNCVRRLLDAGVDALFLLGSSGEYTALNPKDRARILSTVLDEAGGKARILVGVTGLSDKSVEENIAACGGLPIDAYVISPPYYFPLSQNAIAEFYKRIAAISDKPIFIYNISQMAILPETMERIVGDNPAIIGVKDSTSHMLNVQEIIKRCRSVRPDINIYQGTEELVIPTLVSGGYGIVPGLGNVDPKFFLSLGSRFQKMDFGEILSSQEKIIRLSTLYRLHGSAAAGIKRALRLLGIISNDLVNPPLKDLPEADTPEVRRILEEFNLRD